MPELSPLGSKNGHYLPQAMIPLYYRELQIWLIYHSKSGKLSIEPILYSRSGYHNLSSGANCYHFTTHEIPEKQGVLRLGTQIPDRCQSVGFGYQGWPSCSLRDVDEGGVLPSHKCPGTFGDLQRATELCLIPQRDEPGCLRG